MMGVRVNAEFLDALQGALNAEAEIVRGCTARLRVPRNDAMRPKNEFIELP
jgi:hypothetical protein